MPVRRDSARPNNPTALGGIAGRFAGRFASADQPRGIRAAVEALAHRRASLHEAHHEVMEALGEMVWASQRSGLPFDGEGYIERIRMRAGH